jgi:hypothetical protein
VDFGSFSKTRNVAVRVQLRLDDEGVGSGLSGGSAGAGAGASKSRVISTVHINIRHCRFSRHKYLQRNSKVGDENICKFLSRFFSVFSTPFLPPHH